MRRTRIVAPKAFENLLSGPLADGFDVAYFADGESAAAKAAEVEPDIALIDFWDGRQLARLIEAGTALRWIASLPAGIEPFDLELLRRRGIALTNGSGIGAIPIAEFTVLGMLALIKRLPEHVAANEKRQWLARQEGYEELFGSKVLIVGYGHIGQRIAHLVSAFGADVTGVRRQADGPGVLGPDDWRGRIGEFDWIVLSATPGPRTNGIIGPRELAAIKPTARLANVSRGSLVDQPALIEALKAGRLAGAYLDVTTPEPLPPESALWTAPNLIVTSHNAASSHRRRARGAELFLQNLELFAAGKPLVNSIGT